MMLKLLATYAVLGLIYFCLIIIVFTPTLYAFWIWFIERKVLKTRQKLLRTSLTVLLVNFLIAYFLFQFASNYVVPSKVAQIDSDASSALANATESQKKFYALHGKYYSVGPVKGPYTDEHGLKVGKDVILRVEPKWDKLNSKDDYEAVVIHIFGQTVFISQSDGKIHKANSDSEQYKELRSMLMNSIK